MSAIKKPNKDRISPKQAAEQAAEYLKEIVNKVYGVTVEEVELSQDGRFWLLTLSYSANQYLAGRSYKAFKIDAYTGEVVSMKIRGVS